MKISNTRCSWSNAGCSHSEHVGLCEGTNQSGLAIINCNCVAIPMTRWALESMENMNIGDLKNYIHELCERAALPEDFNGWTGKEIKTVIVRKEEAPSGGAGMNDNYLSGFGPYESPRPGE